MVNAPMSVPPESVAPESATSASASHAAGPPELPPELRNNPLLATEGLPPFDRIQAEHVVPAVRHLLAQALEQVKQLEESVEPTWAGTVEKLDAIERPFEFT